MTDVNKTTTPRRRRGGGDPRRGGGCRIRRWCVPPAMLWDPGENLEGSHILEELPDAGFVLWTAFRDVMLWARTEAPDRAGLFTATANDRRIAELSSGHLPAELDLLLTPLARVVAAPAAVSPHQVSLACTEVAAWAREQGARGTAVSFAQAAALAAPETAAPAYLTGELAVEWGRTQRAETWYRRAVGLARQSKEWSTYARAYVQLGRLYVARGRFDAAYRSYLLAFRVGRRKALRAERAAAHHGLLVVAMAQGDMAAAQLHARLAMKTTAATDAHARALVVDLASLWLKSREYGRAIPHLERLRGQVANSQTDLALVHAMLAHAQAGTRDRRRYEAAWSDAWAIITRTVERGVKEDHRPALVELARAAALLQDWLRLEQAVNRARQGKLRPAVDQELVELLALARRPGGRPDAEAE